MISCDVCLKPTASARRADDVICESLKACHLKDTASAKILDRLGVKRSLVQKKQLFGDVCPSCQASFEAEITKILDDALKDSTEKILAAANKTKGKPPEGLANIEFFEMATRDHHHFKRA